MGCTLKMDPGRDQTQAAASSIWPEPPAYYRNPKKRKPPRPPPDGAEVQMYGRKMPAIGKLPPTEPLEGQLYSASPDDVAVISELRRLNRDTLSAYLALLHKMQEAPTAAGAEFAQVRTLLLNVQHLLNSLRPYQAREELIATMRAQLDAKQALIDELRSASAASATCAAAAENAPVAAAAEGSADADAANAMPVDGIDPAAPSEAQLRARQELEALVAPQRAGRR